jgi:tryptophan-rich sensory protein
MKIKWKKLAISMLISFLPAIIGSLFMMGTVDSWYATLNKPWFTPPNWLFGPVWTTLYILMGISLYLVWTKKASSEVKSDAYFYFFAQLAFNGLWTPVFFYGQTPVLGLLVILPLYGLVILTTIAG